MDFAKHNLPIKRSDFFDNWITLDCMKPIVDKMREALFVDGKFFDNDKEHIFQNSSVALNIANKIPNIDAIQIASSDPPDFILRFKDNSIAKFEAVEVLKDYPRNKHLREMWEKNREKPYCYNEFFSNEIETIASIRRALFSKLKKKYRYEGKNLNLAMYINLSFVDMVFAEDCSKLSIVTKTIKQLSTEIFECMKVFNDIVMLWSGEIYFVSEIISQNELSFAQKTK